MKIKVENQLLNFFLCTLLIIFCLVFILLNTLLNKNFVLKHIYYVNYSDKVYNNIVDNFENNLMSANLDIKIDEVVNFTMVNADILNVIDYIYNDSKLNISVDILKKNLINAEDKVLEGIYLNREDKEALEKLENRLISIYEDEILINRNILNKLSNYMETIRGILLATFVIILLIMLNLGAVIIKILNKDIIVSVVGSGLVLFAFFLLLNRKFQDILLVNPAFSELLKSIGESVLNKMLIGFVILIVIGVLGIIRQALKTN